MESSSYSQKDVTASPVVERSEKTTSCLDHFDEYQIFFRSRVACLIQLIILLTLNTQEGRKSPHLVSLNQRKFGVLLDRTSML